MLARFALGLGVALTLASTPRLQEVEPPTGRVPSPVAASPFEGEPRPWGPEQALGAPDTVGAGDLPSAWASRTEDGADEWLVLVFPEPVVPTAVRVFQTFNPGALVAVSVVDAEGREVEAWRGLDPLPAGAERGVALVPLATAVRTDTVKLHLDSSAVEGWNEIDAVGLHGPDGALQWAVDARASTTFAAGPPRAPRRAEALPPVPLDALESAHRTAVDGLLEAWTRLVASGADEAALAALADGIVAAQRGAPAERTFAGAWTTPFGELVLTVTDGVARGRYGLGTVEGRVEGERLVGRYVEPDVAGAFEFTLAPDGASFTGRWRPDGTEAWRPWNGRRASVDPTTTWLVVLEAPWQSGLTEPEYSFGGMLRAIFDHVGGVSVRQRFFSSPEGFEHACADAARLPGPVVLVVAAHGGPEGVHCASGTVDVERLAAALGAIPRLRAVHFSSCSVMSGAAPERILAAFAGSESFEGVSGYTRPVDWMGSALCEFTWLELVLARGRTAAQAAVELPRLLAFAGTRAPEGSAIPPSHFRFVGPELAASGAPATE